MIYRHPDPAAPLNAIVLYDGTFVKQQPATLHQRIEGFYDPANVVRTNHLHCRQRAEQPWARCCDGHRRRPRHAPVSTDLFSGSSPGNALGQRHADRRQSLTGLPRRRVLRHVHRTPDQRIAWCVNDCVAMGAMIYQTRGQRRRRRRPARQVGVLGEPLLDPNGNALPRSTPWARTRDVKDVFIEVAAMRAPPTRRMAPKRRRSTVPLTQRDRHEGHIHMPTAGGTADAGRPFAAQGYQAPLRRRAPGGLQIALVSAHLPADQRTLRLAGRRRLHHWRRWHERQRSRARARRRAVAGNRLRAGRRHAVRRLSVPGLSGHGESGRRGFQLHKEQVFDANRKDSFRFGLYAHAKATPKSLLPCLGASAPRRVRPMTGDCADGLANPLIHVPAGISGTADFPGGGDFLVTLGLWDNTNFVGSDFGVASTTMHELGHTLGLGHGGDALPNCKPNYLSVMNYMFQLGGLIDTAGRTCGFLGGVLSTIDELNATDGYSVPGTFRTSWYAPRPDGDTQQPVKRFCNGLKFDPLDPPPATIRIDGGVDKLTLLNTPIDWNTDGDLTNAGAQDVNFDGEPDLVPVTGGPSTSLTGFDDWAALRLNQVGARRNFAGISIGPLGVKLLSDGSKLLADGSVLLADGSRLLGGWVETAGGRHRAARRWREIPGRRLDAAGRSIRAAPGWRPSPG